MKVIFQHDSPLPVKTYGGIERILFWHMKELARQGHHIVLIGHKSSEVEEVGIEHIPMNNKDWRDLIPPDSDLIHLAYNHTVPGKIPTINTLHGNGQIGETFPPNTVFLSQKHATNHGGSCFIYNALNMDEYPAPPSYNKNWESFLFLAKAKWKVKNLAHCLKAVKETKKNLHIAGGTSLWPHRNTKFHGFLNNREKLELMRKSDALLWPVRWQEPFGLAVIEAMTQGLPVVASPYGSLPELINQDNGILVENYQQFLAAISDLPKPFDGKLIREQALARFSIEAYSSSYLALYERVIKGEQLHKETLEWQGSSPPQTLLPF